MSRFVAIDLTGMDLPDVIEELVYEDILEDLKDDAVARLVADGIDYDVAMLESDPVVKVLEVAAYRETLLRARVNSALKAILIAYAEETDLEHRGSFYGVERTLITAATETEPAVYEDDESLRKRIQLAPEALSTAGPPGAYEFHTYTVDTSIKDVAVVVPEPGYVHVLPLVSSGDGSPDSALLEKVRSRLIEEDIRPMTDIVTVRAPTVVNYTVEASLKIADGPDSAIVIAAAEAAAEAYTQARHKVGLSVRLSGLYAALHVAGVENVTIASPTADVVPDEDEVAYCTSIVIDEA